jgi:hypothetical protein
MAPIKQNYFQFQDKLYTQEEGLGMGAPNRLYFLKCTDNTLTKITDSILKHHRTGYFRHVDIPIALKKTRQTYFTFLIYSTS